MGPKPLQKRWKRAVRHGVTAVATLARTPFLSVASAEADAMLVAVISVWFSWAGPIIAGIQYEYM
jgi:hypothetical protein